MAEAGKHETTCERCRRTFVFVPWIVMGEEMGRPSYCPECERTIEHERAAEDERLALEAAKRARDVRAETWRKFCPPRFLATDMEHNAMRTLAVQGTINWVFGPRGLILHGRTDTGKSRALYQLIKRLYVEEGRTFALFPATDFALQLIEAFQKGEEVRFIRHLRNVDVLAFDDLGKERITERVQSELFGLIDWRINWDKPVIVTTNYVGDTLARRFPEAETAIPLIGRLRNSCDDIEFVRVRSIVP